MNEFYKLTNKFKIKFKDIFLLVINNLINCFTFGISTQILLIYHDNMKKKYKHINFLSLFLSRFANELEIGLKYSVRN